jgi:hypothetical protein
VAVTLPDWRKSRAELGIGEGGDEEEQVLRINHTPVPDEGIGKRGT